MIRISKETQLHQSNQVHLFVSFDNSQFRKPTEKLQGLLRIATIFLDVL